MGFLGFVAVAAALVGGPLVWMLWRSRVRPGTTKMVLLGAAGGEAEAATRVAALRTVGIKSHVSNIGHFYPTEGGTQPYSYEVWVRARDEK
jgi:hypothetical protein